MRDTTIADFAGTSAAISEGEVVAVHDDGSVSVAFASLGGSEITCGVLEGVDFARLSERAAVLAWLPPTGGRGVVLGRIGTARPPADEPDQPDEEIPDELVIEARQSLTLRVGEGSITIREDGKILIKGKDLVSHAKRSNRIRGGSVAIN